MLISERKNHAHRYWNKTHTNLIKRPTTKMV